MVLAKVTQPVQHGRQHTTKPTLATLCHPRLAASRLERESSDTLTIEPGPDVSPALEYGDYR
jgi:hypothetical protein